MDEENVAQFISVTGSTTERALQYLGLSDDNIEQAVELFFTTGGVDLAEPVPTTTNPPTSETLPASSEPSRSAAPHPRSQPQGEIISIDSDEEILDDNDPVITGYNETGQNQTRSAAASRSVNQTSANGTSVLPQRARFEDDDEAMARRMQEEIYAGGDTGGVIDAEGYRAPIGRTTETLVGPGSYDLDDPSDMQAAIDAQMRARQYARSRGRPQAGSPGIFNQQASSSSIWNDADPDPRSQDHRARLARLTAGASEASSKSNMLAEMFRPPFEIMSHLSWEDARSEGKENEKWILVNVQDPAIFDCQVLNRDIWKNPGIKDTVKENFLFMQYSKDDPRGGQYMQYYFQNGDSESAYPHIAIVDPRTGEQVKVWSGPPTPKAPEFLMQLHEFLDRYSLNVAARNPVAKRKPEPKKEKQVERMTEEEMLEMALKNSLAGNSNSRSVQQDDDEDDDDPDALTRSTNDISKGKSRFPDPNDDIQMTDPPPPAPNGHHPTPSPFATISSTHPHTEPPADPLTTTRIQFRHSAGRIVRRFALSDPVERIYEWLKASPLEGKEGVPFELVSMGRNLLEVRGVGVGEAGLRNGTVMVEWVEEG